MVHGLNKHGGNIYGANEGLLDFSANINPLGVPGSFIEALKTQADQFACYPDLQYRLLKQCISEYLKTPVSMVLPGNGATGCLYKIPRCLPVKQAVIAAPTFSEYRRSAAAAKLVYREVQGFSVNGNAYCFNAQAIIDVMEEQSLVFICNPNNPTGTLADGKDIEAVAQAAEGKNSYVVVDECFMELTPAGGGNSFIPLLERYPNVIVLQAVTKFYGIPGVRLGYICTANAALHKQWDSFSEPWEIGTAAVLAAKAVFRDKEYKEQTIKWLRREKDWMYAQLSSLKNVAAYSSQTNFHLIEIGENMEFFPEKLKEKGILIRTAEGFSFLNTGRHYRIALKLRNENEKLIQACNAVLNGG